MSTKDAAVVTITRKRYDAYQKCETNLAAAELELKQLRAQNKHLTTENKRLTEYYYAVEAALV